MKYPTELDIYEFDDFGFDQVIDFSNNEKRDNVIFIDNKNELVKTISIKAANEDYQIYTQVDSASGDIVYSRGLRFVNSFGEYSLVKKRGFEVDNT